MQFVAITQQTCSWLLAHPDILGALQSVLVNEDLRALQKAEFSAGALRMAGSSDGQLLAIWNRDYLSGTGDEPWGVFKLEGSFAVKGVPGISQQVFERIIYVLNQRLQSLVLEAAP